MKILRLILVAFLAFSTSTYAQNPPLKVALVSYLPPFIMQASKNIFYGFDIDIIEGVCKTMKRDCQYEPMDFHKVLAAVENGDADVAVSSIIITADRAKRVNFSVPYLLSQSRFIGPSKLANQPFSLKLLNNKRIGVIQGSAFVDQISAMGVKTPTVVTYDHNHSLMQALSEGDVDLALVDAYSALFWQAQSSRTLKVIGEPISYGSGVGIAVNPKNLELLNSVNKALLKFQDTNEYRRSYEKYLEPYLNMPY